MQFFLGKTQNKILSTCLIAYSILYDDVQKIIPLLQRHIYRHIIHVCVLYYIFYVVNRGIMEVHKYVYFVGATRSTTNHLKCGHVLRVHNNNNNNNKNNNCSTIMRCTISARWTPLHITIL